MGNRMISRALPLLAIPLLALLSGCAQIGSPSGGPKDVDPPELLEVEPAIGSTGIHPKSVTVEFDEYVKAGQWRSQLLVSPPIEGTMDLVVRGREVELTWDADLKANTTYVIQFGDAIVDVNEGNPARGLVYAFSTGTELDTLSVRGQVLDAIDQSPMKGMRVLLYPDTLTVERQLSGISPSYVGTTDEQGHFQVDFLPGKSFRTIALHDDNRNYKWDAGESVALGPESALAGDTTRWMMWAGETPSPDRPFLSEAKRDSSGWATWRLSASLEPHDSLSWVQSSGLILMSSIGNEVQAWGWNEAIDSVLLQMVWHHAPQWPGGSWRTDTMDVPRPRLKPSSRLTLTGQPVGMQLPNHFPELRWSSAVTSIDLSQWTIQVNGVDVPLEMVSVAPTNVFQLVREELIQADSEILLTIAPNSVKRAGVDSEFWPEDSLELSWSVYPKEALGTWSLALEGVHCPGLIELTNARGERLDVVQVTNDTTLVWDDMLPGKVNATWWGDLDGDGQWQNVDLSAWDIPDPVVKLQAIEIRANWEVESSWTLDSTQCIPR